MKLGMELEKLPPGQIELPSELVSALPARLAARFRAIPVRWEDGTLLAAFAGPVDPQQLDLLRDLAGFKIHPVLADPGDVEAALERYYRDDAGSVAAVLEDLDETSLLMIRDEEKLSDLSGLESLANEAPIIRLVNYLLTQAIQYGATDIHIEPFEDEIKVRYRLDGILYEREAPPRRLHPAVISRIKLMAGMDITERRLPQDGRIRLRVNGADLDLRVAVVPTLHGESAVLRILNRQTLLFSLEKLGFSDANLMDFNRLIERPHGMILVTGPTGSGKTTTLYAVLSRLNTSVRKIITIEDPVEYELKGVNQIQVNHKLNFTFAQGVRTIVRHDPDVILIGEIRDRETAEVAIQSALTGHLVFATLHTNDAAGAFTRLLDMGAEEFLVASTVIGVLAQRLVRRICPACRSEHRITPAEAAQLGADLPPHGVTHEGLGCPKCNQIGYRGQIGLFEFLPTTAGIEELVMSRANSNRLRELAVTQGMATLRRDGVAKAFTGVTSLGEVLRVTRD